MKRHVALSLHSVAATINRKHSRSCFELYGYDFMVDADFHVRYYDTCMCAGVQNANQHVPFVRPGSWK